MSGNAQRKYITMPADWWAAIDDARGDMSVSEWLREAAQSILSPKVRKGLSKPRGAHRPKKDSET